MNVNIIKRAIDIIAESIRNNSKASICIQKGGDNVTLVGKMSIITDQALKKEVWQDWFIEHFKEGIDDKEYSCGDGEHCDRPKGARLDLLKIW